MFILRPIRLLSSDSSCSICCSSCSVSVHRNMSSAKRRLERNSPSIFTPLFSQFNLLNMLSNVAVNSLGEMVSPCLKLRSHERFYVSVAHFIWRPTRKKPLDSVLVELERFPLQLASDTIIYATANQRWTADGRCVTSHVFRVAIASQWWYSPCSSSFQMRLTYLGRTSLI